MKKQWECSIGEITFLAKIAYSTISILIGVVPLDLLLCEIAIRDTAKIAAKRHGDPLKCCLDRYRDEDVWDSILKGQFQ